MDDPSGLLWSSQTRNPFQKAAAVARSNLDTQRLLARQAGNRVEALEDLQKARVLWSGVGEIAPRRSPRGLVFRQHLGRIGDEGDDDDLTEG